MDNFLTVDYVLLNRITYKIPYDIDFTIVGWDR